MAKFVRIQSEKTINVTAGLQHQDVTNPDAHIPDRLKISPSWPKLTVLIKRGAHWYPAEIAEWNTVKALANDKILTIGETSDNCDDNEVVAKSEDLKRNTEEVEQSTRRGRKNQSLADIVADSNDRKE